MVESKLIDLARIIPFETYTEISLIARFTASQLKENVEIRDGSRARKFFGSKVEFHNHLFCPAISAVQEGDIATLFFRDFTMDACFRTPLRHDLFGILVKVFFVEPETQQKPVRISIGCEYKGEPVRRAMRYIEEILGKPFGCYEICLTRNKIRKDRDRVEWGGRPGEEYE